MPNPAQQPEIPEIPKIEDKDVEGLFEAVEEHDAAKRAAESAVEPDPDYKALQEENEASLNADAEAGKAEHRAEMRKFVTKYVVNPEDKLGRAAYEDIFEAFGDHLEEALDLAPGQPEVAARLIATPAEQRLMKAADPNWEKNVENLSVVRPAYFQLQRQIRFSAAQALKTLLGERLDQEEDPARISSMHKLLDAVEAYGNKYE